MTLQFLWDLEDAKAFVYAAERPSTILSFSHWFGGIVFSVVGIGNLMSGTEFVTQSIIGLTVGLFMLYWLIFGRYFSSRKLLREIEVLVNNYQITEDAITHFYSGTEDEITECSWNEFLLCIENRLHFLFYDKKELVLLLPKRAFANQSDLLQFSKWSKQIVK
jgi:uncharacterized protein YneF (UPF0154 family)